MDLRVVLIGNKADVEFVKEKIVYPQIISDTYIWSEKLFHDNPSDFLQDIDVAVFAFEYSSIASKVRAIIEKNNQDRNIVIIDFFSMRFRLAPQMNVDYVMRNPSVDTYEGLIFGISHSEMGIIPDRLGNGKYANLSVSSQDLFYNYKTLEYCVQNYHEKIKSLQTIVLDMYDYSYFNYDTSLSVQLPLYLGFGGYNKDPHNFEKNKNFSGITFDSIVDLAIGEHIEGITQEIVDVWEMLFGSEIYHCFELDSMTPKNIKLRMEVVTDEVCDNFTLRSVAGKTFEHTVSENISIIRQFFDLIYSLNPNMKVYLVTIPRYEGAWGSEETMVRNWKTRFMSIIEDLQKDYSFDYLDLSRHEIATRRSYFQDASHFNCYGAMKFTDMLNDYIQTH